MYVTYELFDLDRDHGSKNPNDFVLTVLYCKRLIKVVYSVRFITQGSWVSIQLIIHIVYKYNSYTCMCNVYILEDDLI